MSVTKGQIIQSLDKAIYWAIIILPFSVAIASGPMNGFMGILTVAFLAKKILKKERIAIKSVLNLPLALLFFTTCISIINSVNYKDTLKGGILRLFWFIFIFFMVSTEVKDRRHLKRIIFSICCGLTLISIDGIWQVITGRDFIRLYAPIVNIGLVRATASFKDSNLMGIYLSAFAPIPLGLALYYFRDRQKIIFFIISLISLAGIALTYSRPTLLAIYIVLFFFSIVMRDRRMIIFLILFTFVSPFIAPRTVKDWAMKVQYNPLRFMCNDDRIAIYRNSLNMISHNPVLGVGANTFMKNYRKYKEVPEYRGVVTSDYIYAHNIYLHMAGEIGLIGLGFFIWLLLRLFSEARRIYRLLPDRYEKKVSLSFTACIIAFLVNGLTESSLYYSSIAVVFWYISGLLLSLKKFAKFTE